MQEGLEGHGHFIEAKEGMFNNLYSRRTEGEQRLMPQS